MAEHEMQEIFEKHRSLLITNVVADGRTWISSSMRRGSSGDRRGRTEAHRGEADFIIDGDGAIALPGLVNTHTHAAMTPPPGLCRRHDPAGLALAEDLAA